MRTFIALFLVMLFFAVISCKNDKEKNTDKIEKIAAVENDSTPISEINVANKDSSNTRKEEKIVSPEYEYGVLIKRLKGKVKNVVSNTYGKYKTVDGKIVPITDGDNMYNFSISFNIDGKMTMNDFGRNSGGVAFLPYKYDSVGNALKIAYYSWMGEDTISIIKCKYDQQNNLIEERYFEYWTGIPESFSLNVYDNQNNLIQHTCYNSDGKMILKSLWKYNSKNDEVSFYNWRLEDDSIVTEIKYRYTYEYDSFGNWIYQILYENDEISQIEYREIEYY